MPKEPKPQIRLPDDDGPNPYDSKTGYQPPRWLTLGFWVQIALLAAGLLLARYLTTGHL